MIANRSLSIGAIVLAAGGSSRLGTPKQFVEFEGKTLLRRVVESVVHSAFDPVVIVCGNEIERVSDEVRGLDVIVCANPEWSSGMSSSIRAGLVRLLEVLPTIDAALITLCDQPFVEDRSFERLSSAFVSNDKEMAASEYDGIIGVPAIFSRRMFDDLRSLEGDRGARDLLRAPGASLVTVKTEEAAIDIDTAEDVSRLNSNDRDTD